MLRRISSSVIRSAARRPALASSPSISLSSTSLSYTTLSSTSSSLSSQFQSLLSSSSSPSTTIWTTSPVNRSSNYKTSLSSLFSSMAISKDTKLGEEPQRELVTYVTLNNLSDNPGAIKTKRRLGRGIGSSKGKTCGRGHKGQKARSGGRSKVKPGFEGGQTKFYKRMPKRGFSNKFHAEPMTAVNIGDLQDFIDMKRIDTDDKVINMKDLVDSGLVTMSSVKFGIKLLAKGKDRFRSPIKIEVSRASRSAIEAIEKAGGEVTTVHYNRLSLRALMKPHKFEGGLLPRPALPPPRLMTYYNDFDNRGYLSPQIQKKKLLERLEQEPKED